MMMSNGKNGITGSFVRLFIERIERVREAKKQLSEDEKLIFAEAKASGLTPATLRDVLKIRAAKPADYEEAKANLDMYLSALGMEREAPLFRAVGMMKVDLNSRDSVIEAFKKLVPMNGEIIVKVGAQPVRLWRDKDGTAMAADHVEVVRTAPSQSAAPAPRERKPVPDVDADGAAELGRAAYQENQPITANPFPWDDSRRAKFDAGWRAASGTDGMGPDE